MGELSRRFVQAYVWAEPSEVYGIRLGESHSLWGSVLYISLMPSSFVSELQLAQHTGPTRTSIRRLLLILFFVLNTVSSSIKIQTNKSRFPPSGASLTGIR